jgi:hypothetical protein
MGHIPRPFPSRYPGEDCTPVDQYWQDLYKNKTGNAGTIMARHILPNGLPHEHASAVQSSGPRLVALFLAYTAFFALLAFTVKWTVDAIHDSNLNSRIRSRPRCALCWLLMFVGGLVIGPTILVIVPLLIVNVFIVLYYKVRGNLSPGWAWPNKKARFCINPWRDFCINLFIPATVRRLEDLEARRTLAAAAMAHSKTEHDFVDVDIGSPQRPRSSYQAKKKNYWPGASEEKY